MSEVPLRTSGGFQPSLNSDQRQNQPYQTQAQMGQPQNLQRSYAHELVLSPSPQNRIYEAVTNCIGQTFGFLGMFPCLCCFPNPFKVVQQVYLFLVYTKVVFILTFNSCRVRWVSLLNLDDTIKGQKQSSD